MGRGLEYFLVEGAKLKNQTIDDPYEKKIWENLKEDKMRRKARLTHTQT